MSAGSPQCVWAVGAELGEGPIWHASERAVYFVDIKGQKIHRWSVDSGSRDSWYVPRQPGFLVPIDGDRFVCGLADGLYLFQPTTQQLTKVLDVEGHITGNRLNDGYVDGQGRLWFGTMSDSESDASGSLYRLSDQGGLLPQDSGYVITNGPAMSPDGRTMYHTDTLQRVVYAFDVADDGSLARKRPFVCLTDGGYPDGMAVDSEGCVWIAVFGGWRIDRFSPLGERLDSIRFPCANITKLAFGGGDLCTVYATTAWKGMLSDDRKRQALAGGLFSFRSATPGLPQRSCSKGISA